MDHAAMYHCWGREESFGSGYMPTSWQQKQSRNGDQDPVDGHCY
jgi:hypothetical protein